MAANRNVGNTMAKPNSEAIELELRDISQLFNTLDPFPFGERDLAPEAEEYIVSKALTISPKQPINIVVYLQSHSECIAIEPEVTTAIRYWFATKLQAESNALKLLFRDGRVAFLIGLVILATCVLIAWYLTQQLGSGPFARIIQESFVIVGWVVIWRPAEMFLYDWVPIVRRRTLFRRLSSADVTVRPVFHRD